MLTTIFFVGVMIGAVVFGYLCDRYVYKKRIFLMKQELPLWRFSLFMLFYYTHFTLISRYGRKPILLVSYVLTTVLGFANAFANSYILFAVFRFLTGFAITAISNISVVLGKVTNSPSLLKYCFTLSVNGQKCVQPQTSADVKIRNIFNFALLAAIEWADTDHRAMVAMLCSLAWSVGNMLLAGFAFLANDWQRLIMTVTAPAAFGILIWWYVKHVT